MATIAIERVVHDEKSGRVYVYATNEFGIVDELEFQSVEALREKMAISEGEAWRTLLKLTLGKVRSVDDLQAVVKAEATFDKDAVQPIAVDVSKVGPTPLPPVKK